MKSYVITITSLEESVLVAERCIKSMPEYNVEVFSAFTPKDNPLKIFEEKGIDPEGFNPKGIEYSYKESAMAAFLSHHALWEKCVEDNTEYQIFEHDAIAIGSIPEFIPYKKCISLGEPSYGLYNSAPVMGVNNLFSKRYFPGAHAYRLRPQGAKEIIEKAKTSAEPTDIFLNINNFPWLQEYYPWPVKAKDSFTTIQKTNGCVAKHNWNDGVDYRIINDE